MKVIDLLNMVANGEIDEDIKYQFSNCDYCTIREFFNRYIVDKENLNLEIIEDIPKEDKKIEKIQLPIPSLSPQLIYLSTKINEIIDMLNGDIDE